MKNIRKFVERKSHERASKQIVGLGKYRNLRHYEFEFREVPDLIIAARDFKTSFGYFPITFGLFPRSLENVIESKRDLVVSPVIPGKPYSFNKQEDYFASYAKSQWAITHKKGGWDCMRHLEILGNGSIPLMHDAKRIPESAMFFYPKDFLAEIYLEFTSHPFVPDSSVREYVRIWMERYLTAESVVKNMLTLEGRDKIELQDRILFVDAVLTEQVDYMSAVILSGLLTLFPGKIDILEKAPRYLFDDYNLELQDLYGRGFGYAKCCSADSRSVVTAKELDPRLYSSVVIPNALSNKDFLFKFRSSMRRDQLILVEGGDEPISDRELKELQSFSDLIFIREGVK